ncbi:MAG: outer membrane beta-barrel protein [Bacteroidales bacterium]
MKNSKNLQERIFKNAKILFISASFICSPMLYAQMDCTITGIVIEEESNQPVPYATVGLMAESDGANLLITGTIADENGKFNIRPLAKGKYTLQASSVGYKKTTKRINIVNSGNYDAGTIYVKDSVQLLDQVVLVGERIKGKIENDRTIFFINKRILSASGNTPKLLRHVPGVQVDLKQNLSLEGSRAILLFVNGKERDMSFIKQLNPSHIDRVEIMNTPPSSYDGNASGVINIVLKKEKDAGFSGQFFTEIPTSKSIVYSFPNYSLHYGFKKLNLYTSYNGEINFENIDETYKWEIRNTWETLDITSVEQIKQKNLSHKFHYGFDYQATSQDIINYYGSINPYSYEQDGKVYMDIVGNMNQIWNSTKEETDQNLNVFNSLYYRHLFEKKGSEITFDISNSLLKANNSTVYINDNNDEEVSILNSEKPEQVATSLKIDYSNPIGENFTMNTGVKAGVKSMHNKSVSSFGYNEQLFALYSTFHYKRTRYNINLGVRTEYVDTELNNDFNKPELSVLPYITFKYKLNTKQNILLSYRRSVNRPNVFQLNPYIYMDNPYSIRKGNPFLEPEFTHRIYAEHSIRFNVSYVSTRLFYENMNNAINNLTFLNESNIFETQQHNLGSIYQLGMQFLGSLKFGSLTLSPSIRFYNQLTNGNSLAKHYNIEKRTNWVIDAGFSSVLSLKNDFALSGTFQYSTVKYKIQGNAFCDALYFLSLDKTFKNNVKVGVMAALPFAKTFIYQGSEIEAQNFTSSYRGNLKLPTVPIMFRLSYQFQTGKEKKLINRDKGNVPKRVKSGF